MSGRDRGNFFPGTLGHGTKLGRISPARFPQRDSPRLELSYVITLFGTISTSDRTVPQKIFSTMRGTAGQEGLTLLSTIIKCPTKVSHFWDERDN